MGAFRDSIPCLYKTGNDILVDYVIAESLYDLDDEKCDDPLLL
jgi:hypothetical protein